MVRRNLLRMAGLMLAVGAAASHAETPTCKTLIGDREFLAAGILATQRLYDCCDDTIANCLERDPTCSLAFRLSENICRRVADGQSRERILDAVRMRARSALPGRNKAKIDLAGLSVAGDVSAPVTLVEYACPRCPYCAMMTPRIHDAVVTGPLRGKVKLYFKTFPLRGHVGSKEAGLAFVAAEKLGHFWEFESYFFQRFNQFSVTRQTEWAEAVGMDREDFEREMADPANLDWLIEMKKEGIMNAVDSTPTFFIDGRKYRAELSDGELIDALEEEFDRINGFRYR